jgi:hypothetical protein
MFNKVAKMEICLEFYNVLIVCKCCTPIVKLCSYCYGNDCAVFICSCCLCY